MARRRYFRYYPRTRVAKKKWASNFKTFALRSDTIPTTPYEILVQNSSAPSTPTPTIIKVGNFKVQGDLSLTNNTSFLGVLYLRAYILFVPEGWDLTTIGLIPSQHPEWIMAWTVIDMPIAAASTGSSANKFSMSTRLKRNLNSGDKILFYYQPASETQTDSLTTDISVAAQFWTCAN